MRRRAGRRSRESGPGPNLLDMKPRREVEWEEDEAGVVTLVRKRPAIRGPRSLGRWIAFMMAPPRIRLDEVGSYAWLQMNGNLEVRELAGLVQREFGDRVEPVNQRLGQLIRLLRRERFVVYSESPPGRGPGAREVVEDR